MATNKISLVSIKSIPKCFIKIFYVQFCSCNERRGKPVATTNAKTRRFISCSRCRRSRNNHAKSKYGKIAMLLRHIRLIFLKVVEVCCPCIADDEDFSPEESFRPFHCYSDTNRIRVLKYRLF